ncbi:MAG: NTF2 fold immunity protein [Pseudomonadota bacterium]
MSVTGFRAIVAPHATGFLVLLAMGFGSTAGAQSAAPAAASAKVDLKPLSVVVPNAPEPAKPDAAATLKPLTAAAPTSADAATPGYRSDELGLKSLSVVAPTPPPPTNADGSLVLQPLSDIGVPTAGPALPPNPPYPLVTFTTPPPPPAIPPGTVGSQGAAFSLQTPSGETVAWPAAAKGKPTLLLFWPSWCPYSRALQPYIQTIWQDYRDQGVTVLTINIEETRDPVAVMKERDLSFPLLVSGNAVADAYGVSLMPAVLLMDAQGKVVYKMHEKTTSPIEAAKQVRSTLNGLLGDKAVALPTEYPKAYELHLVALQGLNLKLAPIPIPQTEWEPWMDSYLATLKPGEVVAGITPHGAIANGKQAITIAREIWSRKYGVEQTLIQAPYRSYRVNNHWVVLASGNSGAAAKLGEGFIAVMEVDSGRIVRVVPQQ